VEFVRDDGLEAIAQRLGEALVHSHDEEEKEHTLIYVIHRNAPILADN
jgi:hypothetical protein